MPVARFPFAIALLALLALATPLHASPNDDNACTTHLEPTDLIGMTMISEASFLSMLADVAILGYIGIRVMRNWNRPGWKLIHTPVDLYVLSLIFSDLSQDLGSAISIRWIQRQLVTCGAFCTGQGAIQLIGETGSALATIAIAVHSFLKITFHYKLRYNWISKMVVALIWLYVVLFAGIGAGVHRLASKDGKGDFNEPSPDWCWISGRFAKERLAGEYVWLWIGGFSSLLYIPLYFILHGKRQKDRSDRVHFRILLYPLAYTALVLPVSIARWTLFGGHSPPAAAIFFASTLYQLSGFVNVLLLFYVRHGINLLFDDDELVEAEVGMELGVKDVQHTDADLVEPTQDRDAPLQPMEGVSGLPD